MLLPVVDKKMPGKKPNKSRFQEVCPRRLSSLPTAPCPLALERIHAMQMRKDLKGIDAESLPGCSWYCTSAESNHCFWSQISIDNGPYDDQETAKLLGIANSTVAHTLSSAINKLQEIKDTEALQDLKDMLVDIVNKETDNTVYIPDTFLMKAKEFSEPTEEIDEDVAKDPTVKKPRKRHLYGLYSKQTLERIKREKDAAIEAAKARKKNSTTPS